MKKIICAVSLVSALYSGLMFAIAQETDTVDIGESSSCTVLTYDMRIGSRDTRTNGQVTDLQAFLQENNYLLSDPTGYFGTMTMKAVKDFQRKYGITPNGLVGPLTRGKIKLVSCTGGLEPNPNYQPTGWVEPNPNYPRTGGIETKPTVKINFTADTNVAGLSPLYVQFKANDGTGKCESNSPYIVDFGDGQSMSMQANSANSAYSTYYGESSYCMGYVVPHTYATAGTYTVSLKKTVYNDCKASAGMACAAWYSMEQTVGTLKVTVSNNTAEIPNPEPQPTSPPAFTYEGGIKSGYVTFKASESTGCDGRSQYSIEYGDGERGELSPNWIASTNSWSTLSQSCGGYFVNHTYAKAGTYTAKLFKKEQDSCRASGDYYCTSVYKMPVLVGTLVVTVSGATTPAPTIVSLSPTSGPAGSKVAIYGSGFLTQEYMCTAIYPSTCSSTGGSNTIVFNGVTLSQSSSYSSGGGLSFIVPSVAPGTYAVQVVNSNGSSNTVSFTVTNPIPEPVAIPTFTYEGGVKSGYVTFKASESTGCDGRSQYSIEYGDGERGELSPNWLSTTNSWPTPSHSCGGYFGNHTYAKAGTYTAKLFKTTPYTCPSINGMMCTMIMPAPTQVGTLVVTVSGATTPAPTIVSLSPTSGPAGSKVAIYGSGFLTQEYMCTAIYPSTCSSTGGSNTIVFNGVTLSQSSSYSSGGGLSFIVPSVAPGTYAVQVVNSNGSSNTVSFTVTSEVSTALAPSIAYTSPIAGPVGSKVTIFGNNFTIGEHNIYLDGILLETQRNTTGTYPTSLTFAIPSYFPRNCPVDMYCTAMISPILAGAHTISVQNTNGTSNSVPFTVMSDGTDPYVLGISTACVNIAYNLHRGAETYSVTALQRFLIEKGLLSDKATGFYGDKTVSAVKDYQGMKGLPVTGMVYEATREAIRMETCQ